MTTTPPFALQRWLPSALVPYLGRVGILAAAYFFTGSLGLSLPYVGRHVTLIWPPAGLALAALFLWGGRCWPGVWLGAFLVNAGLGGPAWLAPVIATGNVAGPLLGAVLLRRWVGPHPVFDRPREVLGLAVIGACGTVIVTATSGVLSLCLAGAAPWEAFGKAWLGWWLGDAMGVLVFAPPLLTLAAFPAARLRQPRRLAEGLAVAAGLLVLTLVVFAGDLATHLPLVFLPFPLLIWAALRFGTWGASWSALLVSAAAILGTAVGSGPFVHTGPRTGLLMLWAFIGTAQVVALLISSLQAESQAQDTFFRRVIEAAPNGMALVDREGKIRLANAQLEKMLGYRTEELLGQSVEILLPERYRAIHPEHRRGFWADPQTRPMVGGRELTARRRDGTEVPVEIGLSPIPMPAGDGVLASIIDITQRRQSEEALRRAHAELEQRIAERTHALRESDNHLRDAQAIAHIGSFQWSVAGNSLTWSDELYRIYGLDPEGPHPTYEGYLERVHPDDRERIRTTVGEALRTGEPFAHTYRVIRPDGKLRWAWAQGRVKRDAAGAVVALQGTCQDITERKQTEEVVRRQTEELQRSNDELAQFAYVSSHDLREPLRKIQTFSGRLQHLTSGRGLDEQARDYLLRMHGAATRMQALIDDLLDFSRVTTQAQPFARIDLNQVVQLALSDLEVAVEKAGGRVEVGHLPTLEADPRQMHQLFQNLIGNALKFHRPGVPAVVRVRGEILGSADRVPPSPERCEIVVEDNGIGFEERYVDRIFAVFQRLHGRGEYEGTGIGLAICRKIVERHGGQITATSRPGEGSRFIVTLSVSRGSEPTALGGGPREVLPTRGELG